MAACLMARRPHISLSVKLAAMLRYVRCPGLPEKRHKCGAQFGDISEVEFDHIHRRSNGGSDTADNLRPLCKACHRLKTSGSKATSAGSDVQMEAKAKRLEKRARGETRPKAKIPSRPFQKAPAGHQHFPRKPK